MRTTEIDETESPTSNTKNNLERFLDAISPSVPAYSFSERTMSFENYFVLNDLWESFMEWSTYGIGVPLELIGDYPVLQYYVPYLSAIQIYVDSAATFRLASGGRDLHSPRARSSGVSYNSNNFLLYEFLATDLPHDRKSLSYKINDLAEKDPYLKTLRSCDIQEPSWFSVAWYPIYRIPLGPRLKNLEAAFLTYHNLWIRDRGEPKATISLPAFGMTCYKLKNLIWEQTDNENQMVSSLLQEADKRLSRLCVNQPDYYFFGRKDSIQPK